MKLFSLSAFVGKYLLFVMVCLVYYLHPSPATGETGEPITIGAIFALSGNAQKSNQSAVIGVQMAIEEINRCGGVLGREVKLLLFDNKSTPIGSHLAAEKAVQQGVIGIIGASWSSHSLAVAKVAQAHNIPMISPISTVPSLTAIGEYIFRICYTDALQGTVLASFAYTELNARSASIFVDITSDFSISMAEIFRNEFQKQGGKVEKEIEYKAGQTDFSKQIQQAVSENSDVVFLAGYDESGLIAAKMQTAGLRAIPIGSDGWDAESFYTLGGSQLKRGYFINHWSPDHEDQKTKEFLQKYIKDSPPKAPTALAYDAVNLLVAAVRLAGTTDHSSIRDQLAHIQDFKGVTGDIFFDEKRNAVKNACVIELVDGMAKHRQCFPKTLP